MADEVYTLANGDKVSGKDLYCRLFNVAKPCPDHDEAAQERFLVLEEAAEDYAAGY